jgi:chromosome partitioning protein
MKIVAIASQKGGSGKTTLATHLAVQAETMGAGPVGVIDTDPQGTLADWRNARPLNTPRFAKAGAKGLVRTVNAMRRAGVRLLLIDTPPALGTAIAQVLRLADLVLIPTRPSPNDLRAIGATVALVEDLGKPLVFVINGATPRARITAEAAIALSQHGPVAPAVIHQRIAFAVSMIDGRTAMELPGATRPEEEIAAVCTYLKKRMARIGAKKRRPAKTAAGKSSVPVGKKLPATKMAKKPKVMRSRKIAAAATARKPRAQRRRKVAAPIRTAA